MEIKSPQSPLPDVLEFKAEDVSAGDVVKALRTAGGVVIRSFLAPEDNKQIQADVQPWLDADKPWNGGSIAKQVIKRISTAFDKMTGDFFPPETRRAYGMMGKSRTFAEAIVGDKLWTEVCDVLLTSDKMQSWMGDKIEKCISHPQLMNTIVFNIGPGARAQGLHRDDANHHQDLRAVAEHQFGRDSGVGLFVAGRRTTKQNGEFGAASGKTGYSQQLTAGLPGATRFISGSHLWDYREGPPREDQTYYAELEAGDAFMMLSGCFHGGSANTTTDEERLVYSTFTTRGYLRQEENQYLANDTEAIKKLPAWLQERMGYSVSSPFLGWVNLESPMVLLHPGDAAYQKDLW